jgi:hypothetical protein
MSQIQGTSSAAYALQWQYLQATQQNGSQANASDPMSFGLDPFSGASGQASGSGGSSGPPFSLDAMSALISAQEQSSTNGLSPMQQNVFGKLDADGDGSVTSTELQSAFGADNKDAADYVMSKLDTNGDGSISQSEFGAGTTKGMGHHHHMHAGPPPDASQSAQGDQSTQDTQDPLAALLSSSADGASSQTASNSDGSTTTTITYADGSKVSMTSAAAASGSSGSDTSASGSSLSQTQQNLLEQLIKLQSQLVQNLSASSAATTSLATI